tara:strand:- start:81 stop:458 length:378 start_codon:yes stop_codon:yes gene_type:complete
MNVEIYFNLHKKVFSVRHKGRVIKHVESAVIRRPKFVVQAAGRAKVLREKKKNVHAFVRGELYNVAPDYDMTQDFYKDIKYNPYKADTFIINSTNEPIHNANWAFLTIDNHNKPSIKGIKYFDET